MYDLFPSIFQKSRNARTTQEFGESNDHFISYRPYPFEVLVSLVKNKEERKLFLDLVSQNTLETILRALTDSDENFFELQ
jgi:hypothetical protein